MKYTINIKEILQKEVTVDAEDLDEAFEKVEQGYYDEKWVLDADDHTDTILEHGTVQRSIM